MLAAGTTTFEAKSGYGLDRATEIASLEVIREEGGIPTFLGAHTVPPEFDDADAYLDFLLAEVLPVGGGDRRSRRRLRRARRVRRRAGAPLSPGLWRSRACTAPARRPVHGARRDSARGRSRRAVGRPPRGDGRGRHRHPLGERRGRGLAPRERALPRPPDAAGAAMVDAGAAIALATDFNPGSAFCESLPVVCSLACTQLHLSPAEALSACTVNAAHVLGRADRAGRLASGLRSGSRTARCARLALPRVPPGGPGRGGRGPGRSGGLAALG